ncbi:hypothetical protein BDP27DRAFT_740669 [Rhodocollybia butyracea]|uniref:Uncharacterized protein n=1 Tax=Rhodocollybia butyracea TaxID=206335 RepID=A0A9P5PUA8_9AGAR|nr:hypothetical protein BDP27DRAFT_740669 [Rhodocollybia butyracea]
MHFFVGIYLLILFMIMVALEIHTSASTCNEKHCFELNCSSPQFSHLIMSPLGTVIASGSCLGPFNLNMYALTSPERGWISSSSLSGSKGNPAVKQCPAKHPILFQSSKTDAFRKHNLTRLGLRNVGRTL